MVELKWGVILAAEHIVCMAEALNVTGMT